MEDLPKNKLEDLSSEERQLLVQMSMQGAHIEHCVLGLGDRIPRKNLLELDNILNESYEEFLPKLNTEKLHLEFIKFEKLLNIANKSLAVFMSKYFESFITKKITLLKEEIASFQSDIERVKIIIIPRLKKMGLDDSIDTLESAVIGLEIKLAYDSGLNE